MTDLWPSNFLDADRPRAPVTILKEQASLLGDKTSNLILAEVTPLSQIVAEDTDDPLRGHIEHTQRFRYGFYLVAPVLNGYRYRLFTISNDINLYPVAVYLQGESNPDSEASDEGEFEAVLRHIFERRTTQQLILSMLAQSEAAGEDYSDIPY